MTSYKQLSPESLKGLQTGLMESYEGYKLKGLKLDMSRGKPAADQLDLAMDMLDTIGSTNPCKSLTGADLRNYGILDGIPEAKELLAPMLGVSSENVFVGGNSSLTMMYDAVCRAYTHGTATSINPWCKEDKVKFLCPSPGYDRHFKITAHFGFELVSIPMTPNGPDMDLVEKYVNEDSSVKGIWCVPMYSNPQGYTYSDETVRRFAALKPAAPDFRIFWDNAYAVHHLYDDKRDSLLNIMEECQKQGSADMVYIFASTSKISFPGAGVAAMAMSKRNMALAKKHIGIQAIGSDKLNQLRHAQYFGDSDGIDRHMQKLADALRPKFEAVVQTLEQSLSGLDIGEWCNPKGGYFVSFESMEGCAKRIIELCAGAGVTMTDAGATYPYGIDPRDSNIRIAPSYPPLSELKEAMELFCLCTKIAAVEKLISEKA